MIEKMYILAAGVAPETGIIETTEKIIIINDSKEMTNAMFVMASGIGQQIVPKGMRLFIFYYLFYSYIMFYKMLNR